MKIAFITPAGGFGRIQFGGAERCVIELATAFHGRGHEVVVIAPAEFLALAHLDRSIQQIAYPITLRGVPGLAAILRRLQPDIVMPQLLRGVIVGRMAQLMSVPRAGSITNFHSSLEQAFNDAGTPRRRRYLMRALLRGLHRARRVYTVAISRSNQSDLLIHDRFPAFRVALIPNWAPPQFKPMHPERRDAFRSSIPGVDDGKILLLFAGRLEREKNPLLTIEIARRLGRRAVLLVAGDGALRCEMETAVAAADANIIMLGQVEAIHEYMAAADVVLVPSRYEGYGRVAVEALASGTPVVASDVAGLRDAAAGFEIGEDIEFVGPNDDVEKWVESVLRLIDMDATVNRDRRHRQAQQHASLTSAVERYLALCEKAARQA